MKNFLSLRILALVVWLALLTASCGNSKVKSDEAERANKELKVESEEVTEYSFLQMYSFKNLPLIDSTNFNNFKMVDTLTKAQIISLKLEKITSKENVIFAINYKLNLSPNFITLVVSYYPNENELTTVLVNYDKNYNVIDFKTIAYDEIAEGLSKTVSKIKNNSIEITSYGEEDTANIAIFEISENGEIKAKQ